MPWVCRPGAVTEHAAAPLKARCRRCRCCRCRYLRRCGRRKNAARRQPISAGYVDAQRVTSQRRQRRHDEPASAAAERSGRRSGRAGGQRGRLAVRHLWRIPAAPSTAGQRRHWQRAPTASAYRSSARAVRHRKTGALTEPSVGAGNPSLPSSQRDRPRRAQNRRAKDDSCLFVYWGFRARRRQRSFWTHA